MLSGKSRIFKLFNNRLPFSWSDLEKASLPGFCHLPEIFLVYAVSAGTQRLFLVVQLWRALSTLLAIAGCFPKAKRLHFKQGKASTPQEGPTTDQSVTVIQTEPIKVPLRPSASCWTIISSAAHFYLNSPPLQTTNPPPQLPFPSSVRAPIDRSLTDRPSTTVGP